MAWHDHGVVATEREIRLSTAPTGVADDTILDLDPLHWGRQGALRFDLTVDGDDVVQSADLVAGFMHRGAEKLFEVRDYRSGLALANRHDWLAPICGEVIMARAAEDLLGMVVPERARWLRVLLIEMTRVAALLALLGPAAEPLGLTDAAVLRHEAVTHRERLLALLEDLTGARMHVTITTIGGMREAPTTQWSASVAAACEEIVGDLLPLFAAALEAGSFRDRCTGLAVVSAADAASYGASGVVGRACGIDLDIRRSDPDYAEVQSALAPPPAAAAGDAATRVALEVVELQAAAALVASAARRVDDLAGSALALPLPKVIRVPVGTSIQWLETPLGASCGVLESRGDRAPARYALRTPSAAHAPLLARALCGQPLSAAAAIVSSFPIVVGDLDR